MDRINIGDQYFTGEDKTLRVTIYADEDHSSREDITGWTLSFLVKKRHSQDDDDALVTKTTAAGITLVSPTVGVLDIALSDDDIAAIVGGALYWHELKRTNAGTETVLMQGTFMLNRSVHQV